MYTLVIDYQIISTCICTVRMCEWAYLVIIIIIIIIIINGV